MRLSQRLIERYIIAAVLPYLALALLLLTAVLLTQQAARFAEILGNTRTPFDLAADVLMGLLPNILIFTLPMAVAVGTATGFSRLGSDSELVAMKAAGVGNARIVAPVFLLGALMSALTFYNGFYLAPSAAHLLRQSAVRAALYKLESPVEPNTFNTELPGKVIYVGAGDMARGEWERVFIHWQETGQPTRIVTAKTGRIDTSGEQSELVLSDAAITTLPAESTQGRAGAGQVVTERSNQLRVRLNTGRDALVAKLQSAPVELDEMGWHELRQRVRITQGAARRAALQALHKRLSLCCAPLALALLGAGLGVRVRRGGRGLGVLLSLGSMIAYYLTVLAGDQIGRAGHMPPEVGAWLPTALALSVGGALLLLGERRLNLFRRATLPARAAHATAAQAQVQPRAWQQARLMGLLDRGLLRALTVNFVCAISALVSIFLIFTLFELLRFLSGSGERFWLLLRYLFFLIPLAGTSIAPIAMLVTTLITYALLARRSETVAWWAAGQSVYRLALPGLMFAALVGGVQWATQGSVLPLANRKQEALRAQLRGGLSQATTELGRHWLASPAAQRIYTYLYDEGTHTLVEPVVFEFDGAGVHINRIILGARGVGDNAAGKLTIEQARVLDLSGQASGLRSAPDALSEPASLATFKPQLNKPSELNAADLSTYIRTLKSQRGADVRVYEIALARRAADPFAPLVMTMLGLPLALTFGRRTALTALSLAVGVGLAFWGSVSGFQQLSYYKLLPPEVAAWAPLLVFTAVGAYLLSRART
jgi:LPS export ABC transporter permease LptF/LPS export ABC transporter permease LptG